MQTVIDPYDQEFLEIEEKYLHTLSLENEIKQLQDTTNAIEQYGLTPSAFQIMKTTGLLSGTSLEAMAVESSNSMTMSADDSEIAVEALLDKMKEKAASWSAKIVSLFSDTGLKIKTMIKDFWDKAKNLTKDVKDKVFSKAETATNFVKAHPYKTVAAVLAAALAVVGIIAYVNTNLPTPATAANLPEVIDTTKTMIEKIKWPFGAIEVKTMSTGKKIAVSLGGLAAAGAVGAIGKLGWTAITAGEVSGELDKIGQAMMTLWEPVQKKAINILKDGWTIVRGVGTAVGQGAHVGYNSTRPEAHELTKLTLGTAGAVFMGFGVGVVSLMYVLYKLVKTIVCGSFRLVCSTFNLLQEGSPSNKEYI